MLKNIFIILSILFTFTQAQELKDVSLQLKWKYQFQFAGFIVAKEKGFYRDVGLNVDIKEYNSSVDVLKDVLDNKVQFGVSDSALILESIKGVPIIGIMPIYQTSPYVLISLKSSNIKSIEDLNNKKLAIYDDVNGMAVKSMLKAYNIDYINKSVENTFEKLQNGEIDSAIAYISNEPFVAKELGMEIDVIKPDSYGFERYGDILFTSSEMLKNRPEIVERMHEATLKGFEYAFTHIDEVVELIYSKYNDSQKKSKVALYYEAKTLKEMSGIGKNFGIFSEDKLKSIAYIYNFTELGKYNISNLESFIYKKRDSSKKFGKFCWIVAKI